MCWSRALISCWTLLLVQLLCLEAVPISMDKTKVKEPEKTPEEPPASVVRRHGIYPHTALCLHHNNMFPVPLCYSHFFV